VEKRRHEIGEAGISSEDRCLDKVEDAIGQADLWRFVAAQEFNLESLDHVSREFNGS